MQESFAEESFAEEAFTGKAHPKSYLVLDDQEEKKQYSTTRYYTAIAAFMVSNIISYGGYPLIPFLPYPKHTRLIIFIIAYALSNIFFYASLFIGGPIFYQKIKKYVPIDKIKSFFSRNKTTETE